MQRRRVVLVSGAPGAGKTTLAVPLASALGFPLLAKDDVKEAIWDAVAPPMGVEWSRRLGGAAMEAMWAVAARCPSVVIEAPFRPTSDYERQRIVSLDAVVVEVHCLCPPEVAKRRYDERNALPDHHPAHALRPVDLEMLQQFQHPVALGPVVTVDTTTPTDIPTLKSQIEHLLQTEICTVFNVQR